MIAKREQYLARVVGHRSGMPNRTVGFTTLSGNRRRNRLGCATVSSDNTPSWGGLHVTQFLCCRRASLSALRFFEIMAKSRRATTRFNGDANITWRRPYMYSGSELLLPRTPFEKKMLGHPACENIAQTNEFQVTRTAVVNAWPAIRPKVGVGCQWACTKTCAVSIRHSGRSVVRIFAKFR